MIKNLILDVGNVLMTYDWVKMLTEYGLSEEDARVTGSRFFTSPLWAEMDRGVLLEKDVMNRFIESFPADEAVIRYFFAYAERMVVKRPKVWRMVRRLKKAGLEIYLLSNYSEGFFYKQISVSPILPMVDGAVVSFQVNFVKPEKEIYEILLKRYRLIPEECVFFDDREENIGTAERMGIRAIRALTEEGLLEDMGRLLKEVSAERRSGGKAF